LRGLLACLAASGPLSAADAAGSGASLPAVPPDAPATQPAPSPSPGRATAPEPPTSAPAAAVEHRPQLDELRALIKHRTESMDEADRAIEKQDKLVATLEVEIAQIKQAITTLQSLGDQLAAAKKAMQVADEQVASEYQQNHDYRTNTGGASQGAIDGQASAQQNYAQLKRQAADAPDQIQDGQSRLAALTHERASAVKRRDRYRADRLADQKAIEKAEQDIQAIEDVLASQQAALAAGSASATAAAVGGSASATSAAVTTGAPAAPSASDQAP
jgi:hypothetical protein